MINDVLTETLWPTRCVICDYPGKLLCKACTKNLGYIDALLACPHCGSPYGSIQCTECADEATRDAISHLDACCSVGLLQRGFGIIVATYKDRNEQRLGSYIATMINHRIPTSWLSDCQALTTIPDSRAAKARRGFDHMVPIAQEISRQVGIPYQELFYPPITQDQRILGRHDRFTNMKHTFILRQVQELPQNVILIDDVFTTGATLNAAAMVLKKHGVTCVKGVTLARA